MFMVTEILQMPEVQYLGKTALAAAQAECLKSLIAGAICIGSVVVLTPILMVAAIIWDELDGVLFFAALPLLLTLIGGIIILGNYAYWLGLTQPDVFLMHNILF
jgi:hypothetical protein